MSRKTKTQPAHRPFHSLAEISDFEFGYSRHGDEQFTLAFDLEPSGETLVRTFVLNRSSRPLLRALLRAFLPSMGKLPPMCIEAEVDDEYVAKNLMRARGLVAVALDANAEPTIAGFPTPRARPGRRLRFRRWERQSLTVLVEMLDRSRQTHAKFNIASVTDGGPKRGKLIDRILGVTAKMVSFAEEAMNAQLEQDHARARREEVKLTLAAYEGTELAEALRQLRKHR